MVKVSTLPEKRNVTVSRAAAGGLEDMPQRLREARERAGLSLRQLAQRLSISASALSQIETGKSQPSVRTLYAVVSELSISLDDLFDIHPGAAAARATGSPVLRAEARPRMALSSGVVWDRLTSEHDPQIDFLHVTYMPGSTSNSEGALLRHAGREYGFVLTGSIDVTLGFETYHCEPGDSVCFGSEEPHLVANTGGEPATAIWLVVGRRKSDARPRPPDG